MKVLHQVTTNKNYARFEKGKISYCPVSYYGKGLYENVVYLDYRRKDFYDKKCSYSSKDVIPFDLNSIPDKQYFRCSFHTFRDHIMRVDGYNCSAKVCEVDDSGNVIRELDENEVLDICNN